MNQLSISIARVVGGLLFLLGSLSNAESAISQPVATNKVTFRLAATWPAFSRGSVSGAKIVGDYAYVLVGGSLVVYEIAPSGNLVERGSVKPAVSHSLMGRAFDDPAHPSVDSHYAYLCGGRMGITIIDIADPTKPTVLLGSDFSSFEDAGKVAVSNGKAYLMYEKRLELLDVSHPAAPVKLGACTMESSLTDFAVAGERVYLLAVDALHILDVSVPSAPKKISQFPIKSLPRFVQLKGNSAFVIDDYGTLTAIDVFDSLKPALISKLKVDDGYPYGGFLISGDYGYYGRAKLHVIDLRDPRNLSEVPGGSSPSFPLDCDGKRLLASRLGSATGGRGGGMIGNWAPSEVSVLDVSDPSRIAIKSFLDLSGMNQEMAFKGHYAYIAQRDGLRVLDISNPQAPVSVRKIDIVGSTERLSVAGDLLYVECPDNTSDLTLTGYGFQIFDVSTPERPKEISKRVVDETHWNRLILIGNYGYWWNWRKGGDSWRVMDLTDPKEPKIIPEPPDDPATVVRARRDETPLAPDYGVVGVRSNWFFVLRPPNTLAVYSVADPLHPKLIGKCDTGNKAGEDQPIKLTMLGDIAYLMTRSGHLRIVDIKDPTNPVLISSQFAEGLENIKAGNIKADGHYLYALYWQQKESSRLRVFDVSDLKHPLLAGELEMPPYVYHIYVLGKYLYAHDSNQLFIYENVDEP